VPNAGTLMLLTSSFKAGFKCLFHLPSYHEFPYQLNQKLPAGYCYACFSFEGCTAGENMWSHSCKPACRKIQGMGSVAATRPLADTFPVLE